MIESKVLGAELLEEYGCRIATDGNIVSQMTIPFNQVSAVWVELAPPLDPWVRLLVRSDQTLRVVSSIARRSQVCKRAFQFSGQ